MALTTTTTTGGALKRARELAGLSVGGAARRLGVNGVRLRAWEAGRSEPDEYQLDAAISLYGSDLHDIWPDRTPLVDEDDPEVLVVGDERIDLRVDEHGLRPDNRTILVRYLAAVRRQRGVDADATIELRGVDLLALSAVLDLDDRDLERTLVELLDLTPAGSRTTMRALVVGSLMAVGAATIVTGSWLAPTAPDAAAVTATQTASQETEVSATAVTQVAGTSVARTEVTDTVSPFSVEANEEPAVELGTAVFAVAPASGWTPVDDGPFSVDPVDGAPGIIDDSTALPRGT